MPESAFSITAAPRPLPPAWTKFYATLSTIARLDATLARRKAGWLIDFPYIIYVVYPRTEATLGRGHAADREGGLTRVL